MKNGKEGVVREIMMGNSGDIEAGGYTGFSQ